MNKAVKTGSGPKVFFRDADLNGPDLRDKLLNNGELVDVEID